MSSFLVYASRSTVVTGEDFHRLVKHSRVVSTLMKNLTLKEKALADKKMSQKGAKQFRGW